MYIVTVVYKLDNTVDKSKEMTANELAAYIADIHMSEVKSYTVEEVTALQSMVHKLDNVQKGFTGYLAPLPEVKSILAELSEQTTANVWYTENKGNTLGVEIKIGFTLDRSEL